MKDNNKKPKGTAHIKTHEDFMKEVESDWAKGDYSRFYPPKEAEARFNKAFTNLCLGVGGKKSKN